MRAMSTSIISLSVLLCVVFSGSTAVAGDWFQHRFGELRAYHGAWLNVCDEKGAGACRAVQSYIPQGTDRFFGQSKLTIYVHDSGGVSLEIYDEGMPKLQDVALEFDFGTEVISVHPQYWSVGGKGVSNLLETVYLPPGEVATTLVKFIRAKNRLIMRYPMGNGRMGQARFSLRGSSAALRAIQAHLSKRQTSVRALED